MRKILLLQLIMHLVCGVICAQDVVNADSIMEAIQNIKNDQEYTKQLENLKSKKKHPKVVTAIDSISSAIIILVKENKKLNNTIVSQQEIIHTYEHNPLLCKDASVFEMKLLKETDVPQPLKGHWEALKMAQNLLAMAKILSNDVVILESKQVKETHIAETIVERMEALYEGWSTLSVYNMTTFTDVQKKYLEENIRNPYNKLYNKYFNE